MSTVEVTMNQLKKAAEKSKEPANTNDLFDELQDKEIEIKGASINDALCSYSYELLKGPTIGDTLSHKGSHIIHEDLQEKFNNLRVFLAHLDDAYTGNDNATALDFLVNEPETEHYFVTGFKLTGSEENKSLIIVGGKDVAHGTIKFETPKVKLQGYYLYLHDLKTRLYEAIIEVEKYRDGKTAPADDPDQFHMTFEQEDDAFENSKV